MLEKLFENKNKNMTADLKIIYNNANCTNQPPEWFFPQEGKGGLSCKPGTPLHNAFTLCNACKIKQECFNFAKNYKCVGVWGGRLFTYNGISKMNK